MFVALFFLLALFFSPLAGMIPAYASAAALLYVACVMARGLAEIDWDDITEYAPAVVAAVTMPLTYSIATGIGLGFITYALCKILAGKFGEATPAVLVLAVLFAIKFAVRDEIRLILGGCRNADDYSDSMIATSCECLGGGDVGGAAVAVAALALGDAAAVKRAGSLAIELQRRVVVLDGVVVLAELEVDEAAGVERVRCVGLDAAAPGCSRLSACWRLAAG